MDFNAENLKNIYINWIKKSNFINLDCNWIEIKTPFTDFTGSVISIFAQKRDGKYILTDYGNVMNELDMHNIQLSKPRKDLLNKILSSQKCIIDSNNGICIEFDNLRDFPKYKHQLIQAIINISDLFYTSKSSVENLFIFDVFKYLDEIEVSYSSRPYSIEGKELSCKFDINIGQIKNRNIPALHTKIINRLSDNTLKSVLYSAEDLILDKNEKIAAILNDSQNEIEQSRVSLLKKYDIEIISWRNRNNYFKKYIA